MRFSAQSVIADKSYLYVYIHRGKDPCGADVTTLFCHNISQVTIQTTIVKLVKVKKPPIKLNYLTTMAYTLEHQGVTG